MSEIEVLTFSDSRGRVDSALALTPQDALGAGQQLYDEARATHHGGDKITVGFYVNGQLAILVSGRPTRAALPAVSVKS